MKEVEGVTNAQVLILAATLGTAVLLAAIVLGLMLRHALGRIAKAGEEGNAHQRKAQNDSRNEILNMADVQARERVDGAMGPVSDLLNEIMRGLAERVPNSWSWLSGGAPAGELSQPDAPLEGVAETSRGDGWTIRTDRTSQARTPPVFPELLGRTGEDIAQSERLLASLRIYLLLFIRTSGLEGADSALPWDRHSTEVNFTWYQQARAALLLVNPQVTLMASIMEQDPILSDNAAWREAWSDAEREVQRLLRGGTHQ